MPLTNGETFAEYKIIRLLGSGGMGEVYLAQHPRLPRRDALKLLPRDWSADADYRARFNREADLASTLWHPHIVGVHDRGEEDSQLWISMDFVDGLDAARLLAGRYPNGMPLDEVVRMVTAVASALDYAHKQGLLHRDVKPANIMMTHLDDDGEQRILLTDFGIARNIDDISGLTATNMTVGTVAYSAPEQLLGEEVDGKTDQYALAATVYHLLTGSHLFSHSNPAVVIGRHLNNSPPRLADTRGDLAGLDATLARALAKQPRDRFERCADFARALNEHVTSIAAHSLSTPTVPAPAAQSLPRKATASANKAPTAVGKVAAPVRKSTAAKATAPAKTATPSAPRGKSPVGRATSGQAVAPQDQDHGRESNRWIPWSAAVAAVAVVGGVAVAWHPWERQSDPGRTRPPEAVTSTVAIAPPPAATTVSTRQPPPSFSPKAIDQVLLTADQLTRLLRVSVTSNPAGGGGGALAMNSSSYGMSDHSGQVTPRSCTGVAFTGEHDVYAAADPAAIKTQTFGNLYSSSGNTGPYLLQQTAAIFSSADQAQSFLNSSQTQWSSCSRNQVDVSLGFENGRGYTLGRVQQQNNLITVAMASPPGENSADACQQALGVQENIVVEARTCAVPTVNANPGYNGDPSWATRDAERVAKAMLENVKP